MSTICTPSSAARLHSRSARSLDFVENKSSMTSGGMPSASSSLEFESKTHRGSRKCLIKIFAERRPKPRTRNILRAAFVRSTFSTPPLEQEFGQTGVSRHSPPVSRRVPERKRGRGGYKRTAQRTFFCLYLLTTAAAPYGAATPP